MHEFPDYNGISNEKLFHMRGVAQLSAKMSHKLLSWPEDKCREMQVLGYLHDIGYQFGCNQADHNCIGGEILHSSGYKYWKEVYWHGVPSAPYASDELMILNIADMQIDSEGNLLSMEERLNDISFRYGIDSEQYTQAKKLIVEIRFYLSQNKSGTDLI